MITHGGLVTWVGINDLAYESAELWFVSSTESCYRYITDPAPGLQQLFELQSQLYEHGPRNFCYVDVPPVDRTPACKITILSHVDLRINAAYSGFQVMDP
jgi:hypothetical protein